MKDPEKRWPIPLLILGAIGLAILTATTDWFDIWYRSPSSLRGNVADPPGSVLVLLDNGIQEQNASDIDGFFLFEKVTRGIHRLRFEYDGYHPKEVEVNVVNRGQNKIRKDVQMVALADSPEPSELETIRVAFVPSYSSDGSVTFSALEELMQDWQLKVSRPDTEIKGWLYVGEYEQGVWTNPVLDVGTSYPPSGQSLFTDSPIMIWADAPEKKRFRGFLLGDFLGVAEAGSTITFTDSVYKTDGGKVWALVDVQENEGSN